MPEPNEYPKTITVPCLLCLDIHEGENPEEVAEDAIRAYQDMMEHGGWVGRGDWIARTSEPATVEG